MQAANKAAFDAAIAGLHYGSISVNCSSIAAYATPKLCWGAYARNPAHVRLIASQSESLDLCDVCQPWHCKLASALCICPRMRSIDAAASVSDTGSQLASANAPLGQCT